MSKNHLNINISASKVGAYFGNSCLRYMAYNILATPEEVGWDEKKMEHTALTDAGKVWEWDVLKMLSDAGLPVYAEDTQGNYVTDVTSITDKINGFADLSEETTLDILRNPEDRISGYSRNGIGYIYQATLKAPKAFIDSVVLQNEAVKDICGRMFSDEDEYVHANFSICKPDLIMVERGEDGI